MPGPRSAGGRSWGPRRTAGGADPDLRQRPSGSESPTPPPELWPQPGSFRGSAEKDVRMLIDLVGLRPTDRILDVGCGPGRIALALREHLSDGGMYEGFDVRAAAVAWAREHVAAGRSNIRFHHVDLFNRAYNPQGALQPAAFRFPYDDRSFDLVLLFSVFTHIVKEDLERYLAEVVRVLVPRGRVAASFFLLDEPGTIKVGSRELAFVHRFPGFLAIDAAAPEKAVAYRERDVRNLYRGAGLEVVEPVRYGAWRGVKGAPMNQDLIVARRR